MLPLRHDRHSNPRGTRFLTTPHARKLPLIRTRYIRLFIILVISALFFSFLRNARKETRRKIVGRDFQLIRDYEKNLPQNTLYHPKRMVKFSNEVWGLGFNNQLNNRYVAPSSVNSLLLTSTFSLFHT